MSALVEFRRVAFAYPPHPDSPSARAFSIRELSFAVGQGEIFGVIGPNASGKTTLIRLLSRVLAPSEGEILLGGERLARLPRAVVARRIAVVPQDVPQGFPHTVEELVLMGRFPHAPGRFFESDADRAVAREAMAMTEVLGLRGEQLDRLSGGERQRVILARALAQQPRLLVLDEPTAHLDLRYQAECAGLLRRLNREVGLSIVLVSHDLGLAAELGDRLLLLADGAAVSVGPAEAVLEEATLEAVFGCRVVVDKHPVSRRPTVQVIWPNA
ncbi:MAG TPA: ABC transporter ATP-binding protein [Methylomirabilota bacterium]|nr:ABC transporter ATP-binding protein [Methylomirabilota bacterium]